MSNQLMSVNDKKCRKGSVGGKISSSARTGPRIFAFLRCLFVECGCLLAQSRYLRLALDMVTFWYFLVTIVVVQCVVLIVTIGPMKIINLYAYRIYHIMFTRLNAAAFIKFLAFPMRRLFKGGVYSRAAFILGRRLFQNRIS